MTVIFAANGQPHSGKQSFTINATDGVSIAYELHGKGSTALVFVHGWSCDKSYWKEQVLPFSDKYKVVAIDLGGHGESGLNRQSWTMESFGKDVATVVKKLRLNRVILIGHSMGGDVIAEAALLLKGQILGLVMVDTYKQLGPGRTPEAVAEFKNKLSSNFAQSTHAFVRTMFLSESDSALVEMVAKDMASAPPSVALSSLEFAMNYSRQMPQTLQELRLPIIALNPDDSPTDEASMKKFDVEVIIMTKVGHFLMLEDPNRFNMLLEKAITQIAK